MLRFNHAHFLGVMIPDKKRATTMLSNSYSNVACLLRNPTQHGAVAMQGNTCLEFLQSNQRKRWLPAAAREK